MRPLALPTSTGDSSNTTGHRLRTGDVTNNVARRIGPLVRLMPSGVSTPPSVTSVLGTKGRVMNSTQLTP
eukprot:CAMPEP_0113679376 /NCGR_PEP_ID=MMETSP0038_2-20120614/10595_1 /TAXON_ID=2898 /ORGANISM="Cryptomonas paramecium" /LENGTH=69 /DNA_ID=CAMNT_0000597371 /DNA_START=85 /DNA_END=290 /DNA_ORIENTATION=+ /assembly_acc=CAM_ASM_000170